MKYTDLSVQTQRDAPNNARTLGFAFLVRGGYLTRDNQATPLGEHALKHLENLSADLGDSFLAKLDLPLISNQEEGFFPLKTGTFEVIHCKNCGYTARAELAHFAKRVASNEEPLPMEKVETPDCNTIEDLANYLDIPKALKIWLSMPRTASMWWTLTITECRSSLPMANFCVNGEIEGRKMASS